MVIVSACLAGIHCKYNGKSNENKYVKRLVAEGKAIPICPEQLGGFSTPRPTAEIAGGTGADVLDQKCKVLRSTGEDVTEGFIKGAYETLEIAKTVGAKKAIMKSKSPSCGFGKIYDGTFTGTLINGKGIASELLERNGIDVLTEHDVKSES